MDIATFLELLQMTGAYNGPGSQNWSGRDTLASPPPSGPGFQLPGARDVRPAPQPYGPPAPGMPQFSMSPQVQQPQSAWGQGFVLPQGIPLTMQPPFSGNLMDHANAPLLPEDDSLLADMQAAGLMGGDAHKPTGNADYDAVMAKIMQQSDKEIGDLVQQLSDANAASQQSAGTAQSQYADAAAAPQPSTNPMADAIMRSMGSSASMFLGGNKQPQQLAENTILGEQHKLDAARLDNLKALEANYQARATAALKMGDLTAEGQLRAKMQQIHDKMDMARDRAKAREQAAMYAGGMGGGGLTDPTANVLAQLAAGGGSLSGLLPMGSRNPMALATVYNVLNRIPGMMPQGSDLSTTRATRVAQQSGMVQQMKALTAGRTFGALLQKNIRVLTSTLKGLPDTGSPLFNKAIRSVDEKLLGSKEVSAWNTARNIVIPEIGRLLTSNPNLAGLLTNEARDEVKRLISEDVTVPQLLENLKVVLTDTSNRVSSYEESVRQIQQDMRGNIIQQGQTGTQGGKSWNYDPRTGQLSPAGGP